MAQQFKNKPRHARSLSTDSDGSATSREVRCACQFYQMKNAYAPESLQLRTPTRTPLRTPTRSPLRTPARSPISFQSAYFHTIDNTTDDYELKRAEKNGLINQNFQEEEISTAKMEEDDISNTSADQQKFLRIPMDTEIIVPNDGTVENEIMSEDEDDEEANESEDFDRYFINTPSPITATTLGSRTDFDVNTSQFDESGLEDLPLKRDVRKKARLAQAENYQNQNFKDRVKSSAARFKTKLKGIKKPKLSSDKTREPKTKRQDKNEKFKFDNIIEKAKKIERPKFNLPKILHKNQDPEKKIQNAERRRSLAASAEYHKSLPKTKIFEKTSRNSIISRKDSKTSVTSRKDSKSSLQKAQNPEINVKENEPEIIVEKVVKIENIINDNTNQKTKQTPTTSIKTKIAEKFSKIPEMPKLSLPEMKMPEIPKINMPKIPDMHFSSYKKNGNKTENGHKSFHFDFKTFPKKSKQAKQDVTIKETKTKFFTKPEWATVPRAKKTNEIKEDDTHTAEPPIKKERQNTFKKRNSITHPSYIKTDNPNVIIIPLRDYSKDLEDSENGFFLEENNDQIFIPDSQEILITTNVDIIQQSVPEMVQSDFVEHKEINNKPVIIVQKETQIKSEPEIIHGNDQFYDEENVENNKIDVNLYLNEEIREAFTSPVNTLSQIVADSNEFINRPPEIIVRTKKLKTGDEIKKTESEMANIYKTFPPAKPNRKRKEKSQETINNIEPVFIESKTKKSAVENVLFSSVPNVDQASIEVEKPYSRSRTPAEIYREKRFKNPIAPDRRKRSLRSTKSLTFFATEAAPKNQTVSLQELHMVPGLIKTTKTPIPPKRRSKVSSSQSTLHSVYDSEFTSRDFDSLISEDHIVNDRGLLKASETTIDSKTLPSYGSVNKYPSRFATQPPPRAKKKRKPKPCSTPPPVRPLRNYSSLTFPRNQFYENKENFIQENISHSTVVRLKSGPIIEKMKSRPLPAPPRPPRRKTKTKVLEELSNFQNNRKSPNIGLLSVKNKHDEISSSAESIIKARLYLGEQINIVTEIEDFIDEGSLREDDYLEKNHKQETFREKRSPNSLEKLKYIPSENIIEVETSTQTDPLPENFVCEEVVAEETDIIIVPRRRRKSTKSIDSVGIKDQSQNTNEQLKQSKENIKTTSSVRTQSKSSIDDYKELQNQITEPSSEFRIEIENFDERDKKDKNLVLPDFKELNKQQSTESADFLETKDERLLYREYSFDEPRPRPIGLLEQQSYERSDTSSIFGELEIPAVRHTRAQQSTLINRSVSIEEEPSKSVIEFPDTVQHLRVGDLDLDRLTVSELVANKISVSEIEGLNFNLPQPSTSSEESRTHEEFLILQSLVKELIEQIQEKKILEEPKPIQPEATFENEEKQSIGAQFPHIVIYPGPPESSKGMCYNTWPIASTSREAENRSQQSQPDEPPDQSIPELSAQLLKACSNSAKRSVKQALSDLTSRLNTGDEKKDAKTAMIVIVVLVAALILLTDLTNRGQTVHHHHWEYFNPPDASRPS